MTPQLLKDLEDSAFGKASLARANEAIAEMREERSTQSSEGLSYEILATDAATLAKLDQQSFEKLVYFIDCRGLSLEKPTGIFVSLFTCENLFFIDASLFINKVATARGLSLPELKRRYGSQGTGAPLMLGPS